MKPSGITQFIEKKGQEEKSRKIIKNPPEKFVSAIFFLLLNNEEFWPRNLFVKHVIDRMILTVCIDVSFEAFL